MAITYTWNIPQMNAHIQSEGKDNVIYVVHWKYTGSKEFKGKIYSSTNVGTQSYTYTKGDHFVPYEDTEAFENTVIGWLEDSLDVATMQNSISSTIALEIAPVNEDLCFTWQNSVSLAAK